MKDEIIICKFVGACFSSGMNISHASMPLRVRGAEEVRLVRGRGSRVLTRPRSPLACLTIEMVVEDAINRSGDQHQWGLPELLRSLAASCSNDHSHAGCHWHARIRRWAFQQAKPNKVINYKSSPKPPLILSLYIYIYIYFYTAASRNSLCIAYHDFLIPTV